MISGMVLMFATYSGSAVYSYKTFVDTVAKTGATSTDEGKDDKNAIKPSL